MMMISNDLDADESNLQGGGQAQAGPPSFPFLPGFNPAMFGLHNAGASSSSSSSS